jgi:uncharacterized peroxidase-related enzyme
MSARDPHQSSLTETGDVIDSLIADDNGHAIEQLRRQRKDVRQATQGSFEALFGPAADAVGLSELERELLALRVAVLQQDERLAAFYRKRAQALGVDAALLLVTKVQPAFSAGESRWSSLLRFADQLTLAPAVAQASHLAELRQRGLSLANIVSLAQLIAFVNYQLSLLAGLRALRAPASADTSSENSSAPGNLLMGQHGVPDLSPAERGFTIEPLDWVAWLPTVDLAQASAEQLAVLSESHATASSSPYYLTLVHNPAVLRQRSKLFQAIMYGPGGLPRAERELATLGVSLTNGCPYCASVHARLFVQLSKEPAVIEALFEQGLNTALAPRRRAIIDLAVVLSQRPPLAPLAQVQTLRALGLDELQLLDAIHVAAIFAWANRLMQTLGEPTVSRADLASGNKA